MDVTAILQSRTITCNANYEYEINEGHPQKLVLHY